MSSDIEPNTDRIDDTEGHAFKPRGIADEAPASDANDTEGHGGRFHPIADEAPPPETDDTEGHCIKGKP